MGCRKNLTRLNPDERRAFVNAVNTLRNSGDYDDYVDQHQGGATHGHGGPAFFPWHREFLRRFERALQAIDASVNLPYWDFTVENLNSSSTESLIWRDDFMGGPGDPANGFRVTTGPFAAWGLIRNAFSIFDRPGQGGPIATAMANPDYTEFARVEGPHGRAHTWTGGDVGDPDTAVRDPVFWLIHCNMDRLWAEWIQRHRSTPGFAPYLPVAGGPLGHNLNDTMWPWNGTSNPFPVFPWRVTPELVRPADLLDHRTLGYTYDTVDPECRPAPPKLIIKERLPKELKERLPKELKDRIKEGIKDRLPKELKERGAKELKERLPKELKDGAKELKERSPKELKEIREVDRGPFIRPEERPDLVTGALSFEPDITEADLDAIRADLESRINIARTDLDIDEGLIG